MKMVQLLGVVCLWFLLSWTQGPPALVVSATFSFVSGSHMVLALVTSGRSDFHKYFLHVITLFYAVFLLVLLLLLFVFLLSLLLFQ